MAEAYFDLQQACGLLAINREAVANAKELSDVTGSYARTGQGLEGDHRRALTELNHRRKEVQLYTGQLLGCLRQPGATSGAEPAVGDRADRAGRVRH